MKRADLTGGESGARMAWREGQVHHMGREQRGPHMGRELQGESGDPTWWGETGWFTQWGESRPDREGERVTLSMSQFSQVV